ncbi:helicase HerA-like domain-containing protein [Kitasatospora sp. NPDC059462]|uniref:helicase HerA-like domain-containing protein n=1 Tax=Kitasatospora sp. NPDC059462 TaxID=3346841 RepID=UPI0036949A61
MSTHTTPADQAVRSPTVERAVAVVETAAPALTAAVLPFLQGQAASTVSCLLAAPAALAGANFAGLLSERTLAALPGGDILAAHRRPMFVSAVATATAAATVTLQGLPGADALLAGWMTLPSATGLVSVAWWGASGYTAFVLRKVLGNRRRRRAAVQAPAAQPAPQDSLTPAQRAVLERWLAHISSKEGTHPGQELHLTAHGPEAWEGIIEAAPGRPVTVTAETVSGVYRLPPAWIRITDGPHESARHILVHTVQPVSEQAQYGPLETLWLQRVGNKAGCMPGTHLEGPVQDPATGGVAAWIVADEDTDAITMPDMVRIAGALRRTTLLVSVEATQDPRRAILRLMDQSPLERGKALPGPEALRSNPNGFVQLGLGISGRPARLQLFDPKGGARHALVAGVTGSGKGGVLQLLCLSYHVNGIAIIYADPKGSSNPDVEDMSAFAGTGKDGAMGALRLAYAVLLHRIEQSQAMRMKNFTASEEMPFIAVVLDEFAQLLSEKSEYMKEAAFIVAAIAEQGRSLGMAMVLCGQILNLDKMGSDTSIRDNIFYGGALVLLRSDGAQKHRVDLPDGFDGIDPSRIPAYWRTGTDSLVYDPTVPEDDPRRTFGVGYVVGPDERAEMMRAWILESAAGLWDEDAIAYPADFPGWEDRDQIATVPVGPAAEDGAGGGGAPWTPGPAPAFTKEPTAKEKILAVLDEWRDPIGQEIGYVRLDQIIAMTGLAAKTAENTLYRETKAGRIVRNPNVPGEYGLPLAADASESVEA